MLIRNPRLADGLKMEIVAVNFGVDLGRTSKPSVILSLGKHSGAKGCWFHRLVRRCKAGIRQMAQTTAVITKTNESLLLKLNPSVIAISTQEEET